VSLYHAASGFFTSADCAGVHPGVPGATSLPCTAGAGERDRCWAGCAMVLERGLAAFVGGGPAAGAGLASGCGSVSVSASASKASSTPTHGGRGGDRRGGLRLACLAPCSTRLRKVHRRIFGAWCAGTAILFTQAWHAPKLCQVRVDAHGVAFKASVERAPLACILAAEHHAACCDVLLVPSRLQSVQRLAASSSCALQPPSLPGCAASRPRACA
jgi:hypothetical protein